MIHLRRCSNVLAVWFALDPLTTDSDFCFLSRLMRKEYCSRYSPFDRVDDDDTKLLDGGKATSSPPKFRFLHLWPWLSHSVLMSITLVFFTLWALAPLIDDVVLYCRWITRVNTQDLTYHITAPANEAIESIGIVKFNGSFGATSIYRGAPSPEIDSTWDRISFNGCTSRFAPIIGDY